MSSKCHRDIVPMVCMCVVTCVCGLTENGLVCMCGAANNVNKIVLKLFNCVKIIVAKGDTSIDFGRINC